MPAKPRKTDWKRLLQDESPATPNVGPGKQILARGARSSEGNEGRFVPITSKEDLLAMLEANRKMHLALKDAARKKKIPLKGLFGGGA